MTSTVGLVEVLKNIHCPREGLRHLLDTIPSTRRVMHQMCMEGILHVQVYSILTDIGELDLAFRLAVSQGMWDNVQQLSWEPAVSERSRLLALRTAIGQENWTMIQKLGWARVCATTRITNLWADNPNSKQKKRVYRKAFRELVHHDQLSLALQMLPGYLNKALGHRFLHFFRPRKSDLELAVEFCLGHPDRCDMAVQFLVESRHVPSLVLWTRLVTACIEEGKVESLLPLSYHKRLILDPEWPEYHCVLFELALKAGHVDFVRDFCSPFLTRADYCIQNAVDKAIDLEMWTAVVTIVGRKAVNIDFDTVLTILVEIFSNRTSDSLRRSLARVSEHGLYNLVTLGKLKDLLDALSRKQTNAQSVVSDWDFISNHPRLGLVACLLERESGVCKELLEMADDHLKQDSVFKFCYDAMTRNFFIHLVPQVYCRCSMETFVSLLGELEVMDEMSLSHDHVKDVENDIGKEWISRSDEVLAATRHTSLRSWALLIFAERSLFDIIEKELTLFPDPEMVNELIVDASSREEFDFVLKLWPHCSLTQKVIFQLLEEAMACTAWQVVETILTGETVDPCLYFGCYDENTLLNQVLGDRGFDDLYLTSETEHLVRLCIRTGVSTYERATHSCQGVDFDKYRNANGSNAWSARYLHRSPFERVIESKANLSTAKLLYQSGATSYEELHDLNWDDCFTSKLDQENRDYLNDVASTPRTLQDTCRLRVSHLIGCRPGRASRVESLPIPTFAKDLVLFKDITRGGKSPWTQSLE